MIIYAEDHDRIVADLQQEVDDLQIQKDAMQCLRDMAREERDALRAEVERLRSVMHRISRWVDTLPPGTRSATTIGQAIDAALDAQTEQKDCEHCGGSVTIHGTDCGACTEQDAVTVPRELLERMFSADERMEGDGLSSSTIQACRDYDAAFGELRALLEGGK